MFEGNEGAGDGGVVGMDDAGEGFGVHNGVATGARVWQSVIPLILPLSPSGAGWSR